MKCVLNCARKRLPCFNGPIKIEICNAGNIWHNSFRILHVFMSLSYCTRLTDFLSLRAVKKMAVFFRIPRLQRKLVQRKLTLIQSWQWWAYRCYGFKYHGISTPTSQGLWRVRPSQFWTIGISYVLYVFIGTRPALNPESLVAPRRFFFRIYAKEAVENPFCSQTFKKYLLRNLRINIMRPVLFAVNWKIPEFQTHNFERTVIKIFYIFSWYYVDKIIVCIYTRSSFLSRSRSTKQKCVIYILIHFSLN